MAIKKRMNVLVVTLDPFSHVEAARFYLARLLTPLMHTPWEKSLILFDLEALTTGAQHDRAALRLVRNKPSG